MFIDPQKAQPGMIIAEDVSHPTLGVILRKLQPLSVETINVLIRLGIKEINVQDSSPAFTKNTADASHRKPPVLQLILGEDLMSASLIIDPCDKENTSDLDSKMIRDALNQNKIVHGIDNNKIDTIVSQWNQKKQKIEIKDFVKGTPAIAAQTGCYQMTVPHLTLKTQLNKVSNAHYFWEVADIIPPQIEKVNSGTVIAKKMEDVPSIPGMNILGEPVLTDKSTRQRQNFAESVNFSEDRKFLIAKTQGIPFYCEGTIGVSFIKVDGTIDVQIQHDKMAASIIVHPAGNGGSMPSETQITDLLRSEGIVHGILHQKISELVRNFNFKQYPDQPVVIAEGTSAQNGKNGSVKLLFNTETSLKPQQNPDGSVDYKNINIISTVVANQKLAELVPPTPGVPGKNVLGQEIPCTNGIPAVLPTGPNTAIDPQNQNLLLATTDGFVRFTSSTIEISEGLVIPAHVDFSTGNIKYGRNVVVNGDVKSGFDIDCGGDLQVNGSIEDCKINVEGNLLCRMGLIGQGKGIIDVKGDVNLNFTKNQTVKSRQNVNVAKEAINSTIFARKCITVHGKPLSAAGGLLTAGESAYFYTVGNQSGIKTVLEVGIDFTLVEELEKKELLFNQISANYSKLQETQKKYQKILATRKQLPPKEKYFLEKITKAIYLYKQQLDSLTHQKTQISSKMYNTANAFIKIEHSAMPGTMFKFGERHFLVKEEIIGPKTVCLIEHEIKIF